MRPRLLLGNVQLSQLGGQDLSGIADIGGARVDVVSDGGYIDAGAEILVTQVDGNRVVVRRASPRQESPHE